MTTSTPTPPSADDDGPRGNPRGDRAAAVALVLIAVGIWVESTRWPPAVGFAGDPLVLPRSLALMMVAVAATLTWRSFFSPGAVAAGSTATAAPTLRPVLLGILATLGFAALLDFLGLIVAAALYLLGLQRITGAPWRRAVPIAILLPVAIWLIFHLMLNVPLPTGDLWSTLFD